MDFISLYSLRIINCTSAELRSASDASKRYGIQTALFPKNYVSSMSFVLSVHQWFMLVMSVSHGDLLLQK